MSPLIKEINAALKDFFSQNDDQCLDDYLLEHHLVALLIKARKEILILSNPF